MHWGISVQVYSVREKRSVRAEPHELELARGLLRWRLCLKNPHEVGLLVDASRTAELDEVIVQEIDKSLGLPNVRLEERFFQLAQVSCQVGVEFTACHVAFSVTAYSVEGGRVLGPASCLGCLSGEVADAGSCEA
jgi:hypothetical protein